MILQYKIWHILSNNYLMSYPCLLLDISGPVFGIYGVMNTDDTHIICEPLCPIVPLHDVDNFLISSLVPTVCAALQATVERLKDLVDTGTQRKLSMFPYKTSVLMKGTHVNFRYLQRITRYVFLVECIPADGIVYRAIAKFAKTYGTKVHEHCAKNQFAPELLAHEEIPGGWKFVLMDYVEFESISKMDDSEKRRQLNEILECLRHSNFVHADLRYTNVFWNRKNNRVMLIDFDWAGRNGIDCYPSKMNKEIVWPKGAATGNLLLFAHDEYWVNLLLQE